MILVSEESDTKVIFLLKNLPLSESTIYNRIGQNHGDGSNSQK